ncbi:MAG: glycosyltransferase [Bacteroidales bacterium]|nr:glycosyltransferase [Bacteroidales bacterium]
MKPNLMIAYDANNVLRDSGERGVYGRKLIAKMATRHVDVFQAMLFSLGVERTYRHYFTSFANVSTFLPRGLSRLLPQLWVRRKANRLLHFQHAMLFHGLNDELPYALKPNVRTVVTCHGLNNHQPTSYLDKLLWKHRVSYALRVADVVVAVNEEVRREIVASGVNEVKVVVIGNSMEMTDLMAEQYFTLYQTLLK